MLGTDGEQQDRLRGTNMARLIPPAPIRARVAMRLLMAGLAVAAVAALAACGDDDDSNSSSAAKVDTAKLASIQALTESQYTAIKKVYVAALPLDDLSDTPSPSELRQAVQPVLDACDELDADDSLLGPFKATCPATAKLVESVTRTAGCARDDSCEDVFREAQANTQRLVSTGRVADDAV